MHAEGSANALTNFEGWACDNNFEDVVHDDLLGPRLHLCGGVLKELADEHVWGSFCDVSTWDS